MGPSNKCWSVSELHDPWTIQYEPGVNSKDHGTQFSKPCKIYKQFNEFVEAYRDRKNGPFIIEIGERQWFTVEKLGRQVNYGNELFCDRIYLKHHPNPPAHWIRLRPLRHPQLRRPKGPRGRRPRSRRGKRKRPRTPSASYRHIDGDDIAETPEPSRFSLSSQSGYRRDDEELSLDQSRSVSDMTLESTTRRDRTRCGDECSLWTMESTKTSQVHRRLTKAEEEMSRKCA